LNGITKHLNKNRLSQRIELFKGFAALGAQGVDFVQDGGDAFLLINIGNKHIFAVRILTIKAGYSSCSI